MNDEGLRHYNCLSLAESWHSAKLSYFQKNPRFGEMAAYFLGHNAGTYYFFLNTIFMVGAVLLIFRLSTGVWPGNNSKSSLTLLLIAFSIPGFTSDITWPLANMSWLYPCVTALAFFCTTERFLKGDFNLSPILTFTALPLAFITGTGNNNTPIVAWLIMTGCGLYWILFKRTSRLTWQYAAILCTLTVACIVFYTAPGTYARAEDAKWEFSFSNILFNSILAPNNWILTGILLWRLLFTCGVLTFIHRGMQVEKKSRLTLLSTALLMLWGVLILAPYWGAPRSYSSLELLLVCIISCLFYNVARKKGNAIAFSILILHALTMSTSIVPTAGGLVSSHREWKRIETMAEKIKEEGKDVLIVRQSDLNMTPAVSRIWKIPGFIIQYRISPTIPLITTTESQTTHTNHKHKWLSSTWTQEADSGDSIMNPIAARKLGLKAVYYLPHK